MTILNAAKLLKIKEPKFLCKLMKIDIEANLTARNNRMSIPKFKLTRYQNSFSYLAPTLWNLLATSDSLCKKITTAPTITSLRNRLKKFLLDMQNFGINDIDHNWQPYNWSINEYLTQLKAKK